MSEPRQGTYFQRLFSSSLTLALLLPLVACGDKESVTDDTGGVEEDPFSEFINVTDEVIGNVSSCYTPSPKGGDWITQKVDSTKVASYPATGPVEDFESGKGVGEADLEIWLADSVSGAPDITTVSSAEGIVSGIELPSCQPISYRSSMDPSEELAKDTYEAHQVYEVPGGGTIESYFNSVSNATYQLIPGLLGVSIDSDKSVIAGTAFDCDEAKSQNVQVVVVNSAGEIPESLVVKYFVNDYPNRDQPATSEDGLWVAMNVPAGNWQVQAWAVVGGTLSLLAVTELETFADSINISNLYTGTSDGVKYPASCLVP